MPPFVESVQPHCGPFFGSTKLTITGQRFGDSAAELEAVFLGDHECVDVKWCTASIITCTTPALDAVDLGFNSDGTGCWLISLRIEFVCVTPGFLSVDITVRTRNGSYGQSYPRFTFASGMSVCCFGLSLVSSERVDPQFNEPIKKKRNQRAVLPVRAVCHTLLNQDRLVLASTIAPDDRNEHLLTDFKRVQRNQITAGHPPSSAIFVDDVRKYQNVCVCVVRLSALIFVAGSSTHSEKYNTTSDCSLLLSGFVRLHLSVGQIHSLYRVHLMQSVQRFCRISFTLSSE